MIIKLTVPRQAIFFFCHSLTTQFSWHCQVTFEIRNKIGGASFLSPLNKLFTWHIAFGSHFLYDASLVFNSPMVTFVRNSFSSHCCIFALESIYETLPLLKRGVRDCISLEPHSHNAITLKKEQDYKTSHKEMKLQNGPVCRLTQLWSLIHSSMTFVKQMQAPNRECMTRML